MTTIGTFAPGTGGIRDVTIPGPAAGTDWSYTIPARARASVLHIRGIFTTGAAVANRLVQIHIVGAPGILYRRNSDLQQAASVIQPYTWTPNNVYLAPLAGYDIQVAIPQPAILIAGDIIRAATDLIQAADQWSDIYLRLIEWLEP